MSATIQTVRFNSAQYERDWRRLHHSIEQQLYPIFKKALTSQTDNVRDFVRNHPIADLASHLSVLVTKQPIASAYNIAYQKAGVRGAEFSYNSIQRIGGRKGLSQQETKSEPVGFFSEYWRKLMALFYNTQAAERVQGVTDTTKEQIQQLLADAEEQGLTTSETATYIEEALSDPDFNRMRALRIARTESTTAANYGASLGNESADYLTAKLWIAVMDNNTRPDHVDANGQQVDSGDFFLVGGYEALYPGDVSLPASETVNCRCIVAYVPLLSESGIPILKD
jgi:hypothetical protein